ncbi:MAG: hypothetical protein U0572_14835 [Phycisphaerales bacterium]
MHASTTLRLAALAACFATFSASADQPFAYEGFDYGPTTNIKLKNGGTGWASAWAQVQSIPTGVGTPGLTWPNLVTAGNCAVTAGFGSASFTIYTRILAAYTPPNNVVYLSFLMEPEFNFGDGGGISFSATPQMIVGASLAQGVYGLTVPFVTSSNSTVPVVLGQSALLVARLTKNTNGTITYALWVNPPVGGPQPEAPDCTITEPGNLPAVLALVNDGGFATDEIRFGPTWTSVLPSVAPACPADLDHDGVVGGSDLGILLGNWATSAGDLDGNGTTDAADLAILLGAWGGCAS